MSLKEKLANVKTKEELEQILNGLSLEEINALKKELGRMELSDDSLEAVSGGSGYKDVLDILASLFGMRSQDFLGVVVDKVSGKRLK